MEIHEGQIIDGLFKIIQKDFCRGANGTIHLAENADGQKIALKFIRQDQTTQNLESFKGEYGTLLKFSHPNVAKAFHFGEWEGQFYIAQEFVDGKEFRLFSIGEPPEKMVPYFIQALEGLEAIHQSQWLHLDIKSSNVLIDKGENAKIIDFGFAMALTGKELPFIRGSIPYMAPEMVLKKPVDYRADLFSMGVLMYYAVTGQYPFFARERSGGDFERLKDIVAREDVPEKPSYLNVDIPAYLDEILLTLLSENPGDRFGTARAVINALKTHHPENYRSSLESKNAYLIPANNLHIGRAKEQSRILASLRRLLESNQPAEAIFWLEGDTGVGKSHLLQTIKREAEKSAEKISIHYLTLPKKVDGSENGGEEWLKGWMEHLRQKFIENRKPILILVDGIEKWIPPLKIILERAGQRLEKSKGHNGQKPVLICLAGPHCLESHSKIIRLPLNSFSMGELKDYLAALPALRHQTVPAGWVEALFKRTGGNPAEVFDHLHQQDSHGLLFDWNGQISLAHIREPSIEYQAGSTKIPGTTQKRLTRVLENLNESEKEILRWLAVWSQKGFSPSITLEKLQSIMGKINLSPILNDLVSKNILERELQADRYFFPVFSYFPDLTYHAISEPQRAKMHQKICKHIEEGEAKLFHQAFGTEKPKTWQAILALGGRLLYEQGKASLAKELFEQGLRITPSSLPKLRIFFSICLMKAYCYLGLYDSAKNVYETAQTQLEALEKKSLILEAELALAILPAMINTQQFERAEGLVQENLEKLEHSALTRYLPVFLNCQARIYYQKSFVDKKGGAELLQKARHLFEKSEKLEDKLLPFQKNRIRNNDLGAVLHALGDFDRAALKLEEKLLRLEKFPNVFIALNTLAHLSEAYRSLGNYPKALECARKALENAQGTGKGKWILYAHNILAGIHQARGISLRKTKKIREAQRELEQALNENTCCLAADICLEDQKESRLYLVATLLRNGQCCQELGRLDQAIAYYKAGLDYEPAEIFLGPLYLGLGECFLEKREIIKAAEYLNRSSQIVTALPPEIARESREGIEKAMFKLRKMERRGQHAPAK